LKKVGTFKSFTILLKNNNGKLELLNSFQKFIFDKQSAAPLKVPPGARVPSPLATPLRVGVKMLHNTIHTYITKLSTVAL